MVGRVEAEPADSRVSSRFQAGGGGRRSRGSARGHRSRRLADGASVEPGWSCRAAVAAEHVRGRLIMAQRSTAPRRVRTQPTVSRSAPSGSARSALSSTSGIDEQALVDDVVVVSGALPQLHERGRLAVGGDVQQVARRPVGHRVAAAAVGLDPVDVAEGLFAQSAERLVGIGHGREMAGQFLPIGAAHHPAAEEQTVAFREQSVRPARLRGVNLGPGLECARAQAEHGG